MGKGVADVFLSVLKSLAGATGLETVGLGWWFARWHLVALMGLLRHGKDRSLQELDQK